MLLEGTFLFQSVLLEIMMNLKYYEHEGKNREGEGEGGWEGEKGRTVAVPVSPPVALFLFSACLLSVSESAPTGSLP